MCRVEGCTKHEFDRGLCLEHLREVLWDTAPKAPVEDERKTSRRKKKVDAEVIITNDETTELETRKEEEE